MAVDLPPLEEDAEDARNSYTLTCPACQKGKLVYVRPSTPDLQYLAEKAMWNTS
jgi:hypothetical protein